MGPNFAFFGGKKCLLLQQWGGNGGLKIRNYPLNPLNDTVEVILGDWRDPGAGKTENMKALPCCCCIIKYSRHIKDTYKGYKTAIKNYFNVFHNHS